MTDREDFNKFIEEKRSETVRDRSHDLRRMALGALPAEAVTRDPNWNTVLEIIQARIDEAEERIREIQGQMEQFSGFGHDDLLKLKISVMLHRQAIETMTEIRNIPKDLLEGGEKARELMKKYGIEAA